MTVLPGRCSDKYLLGQDFAHPFTCDHLRSGACSPVSWGEYCADLEHRLHPESPGETVASCVRFPYDKPTLTMTLIS